MTKFSLTAQHIITSRLMNKEDAFMGWTMDKFAALMFEVTEQEFEQMCDEVSTTTDDANYVYWDEGVVILWKENPI